MADYVLHCFAQSGNAYKAALTLELAGADWEPRFVDYFGGETRTPEYRAINLMGEVPILLHNGLVLSQSGVILDYLAETLGQFGPDDAAERREILRWMFFDNHKLTSYTATLRFMRTFADAPDPAILRFLRGRAETAWGDARFASRRTPLRRRRAPDDRRSFAVRLPVLARGDRRRLERLPAHPRLARAARGTAALQASLRTDARPSAAGCA